MRALLVTSLLLASAFLGSASAAEPAHATLTLVIVADRSESLSLAFTQLTRLTEYQHICLPSGARIARVHDDLGDVSYTESKEIEDDGRERSSITFRARSETLTIDMTRAATLDGSHPFYTGTANFCTTSESVVEVLARAEAPHELFFASRGGTLSSANGVSEARWSAIGPTFVTYGYETPLGASGTEFDIFEEGAFRMVVPREKEEEARGLARVAAPALAAALRQAGLAMPWGTLRVHFAASEEFGWEAGHYGGDGILAVKPSVLEDDPREGFPYVGAKVLVHEAFHAASAPFGKGDVDDTVAWLLEGGARNSERHVDGVLPNARRFCEESTAQVQCWFFDDRITQPMLEGAYAPGFSFERSWEPSLSQNEDTRRFYYAYSGFIVGAFIDRMASSYRALWDEVEATFADDARCPCADGWLEGVILGVAKNMTEEELFRPYGVVHDTQPALFEQKTAHVQAEQVLPRAGPLGLPVPGFGLGAVIAILVGLAMSRRW